MTITVKFCTFCGKDHELTDEFWYKAKNGVFSCRIKRKSYGADYVSKNKDRLRDQWRLYRESHKEEAKQWKIDNKERIKDYNREYGKARFSGDLNYKMRICLRTRLNQAIRKGQRGGSAVRDLGCSVEFFLMYIQGKFKDGMSWDNWGKGPGKWNIDHIKPLDSFDLSNTEHIKEACHYTNLQPLWSEENRQKSNRFE